jgi:glutamate synthase (ferredoxin)
MNWLRAREKLFTTDLFGDDLPKVLPLVDPQGSDTTMFDNCLEFLALTGRSLPQAIMMMIPEPWEKNGEMCDAKKAFYEFHSHLMEPWDGPAAIGFSDGTVVGAVLDRNGLRPSRYTITHDGLVVMASETGVLDIPPENVAYKGRLQPGRMLLVDTAQGRMISDEEIKHELANERPYRQWIKAHTVDMSELPSFRPSPRPSPWEEEGVVTQQQQAFGYTFEDLRMIMAPMAQDGQEAIGSMGDDTPLAILSDKPQPLFNYFKQLFAQVTNPPLDAIREELVTSTLTWLGAEGNLLDAQPAACRRIRLPHPILTDEQLAQLQHIRLNGFRTATLSILYNPEKGGAGLERAMADLCFTADQTIASGANLLILSDRHVNRYQAAIPALLATAGLHHHLIRQGTRTQVSLIVESGEPREVHHFAVLLGYGADAINPYLAYATIAHIIQKELLTGVTVKEGVKHYIKAINKGVVKVMSKMGISTIQSYRGAQIFEALGLHKSVTDRYFTGTSSRIQGSDMNLIAKEVAMRHKAAFPERPSNGHVLPPGGRYQWREDGEQHLFNPATIHNLQHAVRNKDYKTYKRYARDVNDHSERIATLRGLFKLKYTAEPISLAEVESIESICRRFKSGAMSYGSISKEAHEAMAQAMNFIGGKSNTGEGGEDPARFKDGRISKIKQVASGRFGVTSEYLVSAEEIQIKMAQGAKPGEGGQLPGRKVYPWIAKVRHSTPGVGLISPPPHHDIYSIEDLAQLIFDLKNANPRARINVKLVSEVGVGTIAAGVAKGHADVILISGHDGGTGASPQTSIKHAGLPWELGVAETHQTLLMNNLRDRVVIETDGQLKTGRDVIIAALLGAEEFGFATAPLVALGCIMMRVCHLDTCPVGIATQNPELRGRFRGEPEHVINFMHFIAQDMREIMAQLGVRTIDELVGRVDLLEVGEAINHWKLQGIDLTPVLYRPDAAKNEGHLQVDGTKRPQQHGLEETLDATVLLDYCQSAIQDGKRISGTFNIRNIHRTVGTMVGSAVTKRHGANGLPTDTINLRFTGSAGQSFGAFMPKGMTLQLEGDANDYMGKGLSGGKIIVVPPAASTFQPEENVIIGNVALYGATAGQAYIQGVAGERFAVRNSGATAVVEGVGDHGCEYMTGGRVVVLGQTGRNFAAGMSGGVAYVWDGDGRFDQRCNPEMVDLEPLLNGSAEELYSLILCHAQYTDSKRAWDILACWDEMLPMFVKVMPRDYKQVLAATAELQTTTNLTGDELAMAAFRQSQQVRVIG